MMDSSKHTPTPWRAMNWTCHAPRTVLVDDASVLTGKRVVADCDRDEDAAFIVRAVNSHAALVDALKALLVVYENSLPDHCNADWFDEYNNAKAALAAAGI